MMMGMIGPTSATAAVITEWNPSAKSADITLSGSPALTATFNNAVSAFSGVKALASHSSGKYYWEILMVVDAGLCVHGIGNSGASVSNFAGSDSNSVGWVPTSGAYYIGGSSPGTIQTAVAGDTIAIAVDLGAARIWWRTIHSGTPGNWNNDVIGNQNPATTTGGVDISGLLSGPYFPFSSLRSLNDQVTANFGGSAFAATVPSGFGNW